MDYKLIFIFAVIILVVVLACLGTAKKIGMTIITIAAVLAALVGVVVFVPSCGLSIWVTETIAPLVEFDSHDSYQDGDKIFTFTVIADDAERATLSFYSDLDDIKLASKQFVEDRISALIKKKLETIEQVYTISFKDSYMILTPSDTSVSIIKGTLPQEYLTSNGS